MSAMANAYALAALFSTVNEADLSSATFSQICQLQLNGAGADAGAGHSAKTLLAQSLFKSVPDVDFETSPEMVRGARKPDKKDLRSLFSSKLSAQPLNSSQGAHPSSPDRDVILNPKNQDTIPKDAGVPNNRPHL